MVYTIPMNILLLGGKSKNNQSYMIEFNIAMDYEQKINKKMQTQIFFLYQIVWKVPDTDNNHEKNTDFL